MYSYTLTCKRNRIQDSRQMRTETIKRIEEDREKHKRLRERTWYRQFKDYQDPVCLVPGSQRHVEEQQPDFDDAWDRVSDLGEQDQEFMREQMAALDACLHLEAIEFA
jgi:CTD kinase subunit gamma CTK3 C-terminus